MTDLPALPTERVVAALCREPLGAALWRAAMNEVLVEVLSERLDELEQQKGA